jgi:hypothetical protein
MQKEQGDCNTDGVVEGKVEISLSVSITSGRRIMGVLINLFSTVGDALGTSPALCPLNVLVGGARNQSGRASVWNRTTAVLHRSVTR